MKTINLCSSLAALCILCWSPYACAQVAVVDPDGATTQLPTGPMTHEQAFALVKEEAKVRIYLRTCVEQEDRQQFFLVLSDRYRSFLGQYGRLSSSELSTGQELPTDPEIDCSQRQQAVLQSILDRDASIRHLLSAPPPEEPPVFLQPDPQPALGSAT